MPLTLSLHPPSFRLSAETLSVELARHLWNEDIRRQALKQAEETQLVSKIKALFQDNTLNTTEHRSVTHVAWRDTQNLFSFSQAEKRQETRRKISSFLKTLKMNPQITDIVNIGIGGSHLGNALIYESLKGFHTASFRGHFLSSPDPEILPQLFEQLDPSKTLWCVTSKAFSTLESMVALREVKRWFFQTQPEAAFKKHFVAITADVARAQEEGFSPEQCFWFDEGVGGRFSVWSSAGLMSLLMLGEENYNALLAGAHAMDRHFLETPLRENIPFWLAWLDYYYVRHFDARSRLVEPYSVSLALLPAYLQQLEMESIGKRVHRDGTLSKGPIGQVVWGGVGPNGQHAFHQFLYQSTQCIPAEFITIKKSQQYDNLSKIIFSSCVAQARALWEGRETTDPHKNIASFKPSTLLMLERLDPFSLGLLLSMYEHKVFVLGELYNINVFDQFSVELGKQLAEPTLAGCYDIEKRKMLDPLTQKLIESL